MAPLSPDLTLLEFLLCGHVKDVTYRTKVNDVPGLRRRIVDAVASVSPEMLQNAWSDIEYRFDVCHAAKGKGAHVEIYRHDKIFGEYFTFRLKHLACIFGVKLLAFFIDCVHFRHSVRHRIM